MAGGRPSKFKPEFVEQAQKLAQLGATDREIADFFKVADGIIIFKGMNDYTADSIKSLERALAPTSNRTANLNSQDMADVVKDTKTLFNDQSAVGKQYREGYIGRAGGFDFMENTMWPGHTRGDAATYVCNTSTGITSGTATIPVSGGTGTFLKGDVFINNDKFPCRLDLLYGYKTLRAALATRQHNN